MNSPSSRTEPAPRRILITGGAGFIGSHLAERLLGEGHQVQVLDDLSTGRLDNIAPLVGHPRFGHRIGSVTDRALVQDTVGRADLVFHLAAVVGVRLVARHPVRTIETNVRGTELVLDSAAARRCAVVLASSSEVYGAGRVPFCEGDPVALGVTEQPRGGYACSKAMGEWLALAQHDERDLPVVVARIFNTVGPRQSGRYGMVLPRFALQALLGDPLTVYGDGCQTRCFSHVRDVVGALWALARTPSANGRVFNVGSDREVSVGDLAELVRDRAQSRSKIVRVPYSEVFPRGFVDLPRRVPDLALLRAAIGTRPWTGLREIVDEVLASTRVLLARQA